MHPSLQHCLIDNVRLESTFVLFVYSLKLQLAIDFVSPRLYFLNALTKDGKDIVFFEEQIGAFI